MIPPPNPMTVSAATSYRTVPARPDARRFPSTTAR